VALDDRRPSASWSGPGADKPFAKTSAKTSAEVKELAGHAIDALADPPAQTEERAERKRRLLEGPEEFLYLRRDHKNERALRLWPADLYHLAPPLAKSTSCSGFAPAQIGESSR
jgi:hypothetical protein